MRTDKRSTRRNGAYQHNGVPYPSVTTILGNLKKPGLEIWLQKNIHTYTSLNPGCSFSEAQQHSKTISHKAMDRGTRAHAIIENGGVTTNVDSEIAPFIYGFNAWKSEYNPQILQNEITVFNHELKYAGTADMVAVINDQKVLIDFKTGKSIYETVSLQLAAYHAAMQPDIDKVAVLLLEIDHNNRPTTKYRFQYIDNLDKHFEAFKALLTIHNWVNSDY